MTAEGSSSESGAALERISLRLREIGKKLSDLDTPDGEAVELAREAATLVGEALEQTERAVAGLEQGD
ncbi:MAG: hypothetical protein ACKOL0_03930 [Solirubrobacterales bacterium]